MKGANCCDSISILIASSSSSVITSSNTYKLRLHAAFDSNLKSPKWLFKSKMRIPKRSVSLCLSVFSPSKQLVSSFTRSFHFHLGIFSSDHLLNRGKSVCRKGW